MISNIPGNSTFLQKLKSFQAILINRAEKHWKLKATNSRTSLSVNPWLYF
jgi:hypothetical protein